jgi:hypothetical protein
MGKQNHRIVGNVNFPPVKSLTGGHGIVVVIVVPAFTRRNQGQQCIVATRIPCFISSAAEHVVQRADRHRGMQQYRGGDEKAPDTSSVRKIGQLITQYKNQGVWKIYALEKKISTENRKLSIQPPRTASLPTTAGDSYLSILKV